MQINLNEVKGYLKVEDTHSDDLIKTIVDAAVSHCESVMHRPILDANMKTETTWEVPESIRLAIYLLCSHWFENRLPIGDVTEEMAFSVNALIMPHKFYNI